jgi:uncharacterized protein YmfQ (DUF2313 family)
MASVGVVSKYKGLIRELFPKGWAWRIYKESVFAAFIDALAEEPARIEERGFDFLEEMDPRTTFEMLDNWERLLGLPDDCTPAGTPSIFERRVRVLQKLTTGGGQSKAFYQLIAQQLGYDVDVIDVENFKDFRVGTARVGDRLTNGTVANDGGWAYTWVMKAPAALTRQFRVGQSTVGDRLVLTENETLECVIRKFNPAHTTVLFAFGE